MADFEVGLPLPLPLGGLKIEILGVLRPVFDWYPDTDKKKGQATALPSSEIINSKKYLD